MGNKFSLKSLERMVESNLSIRRYSLSDMISESYKALYRCEDGTNLRKLAESQIADVRENPSDIDRLSRNLSILNSLIRMNESGEVKDADLVLESEKPRNDECSTKKNECDITKPTLKEEIDEAEEPELTDEELEELTKHLEQIRKQRKTASVTESSKEECPHCGKSPCVCEGKDLKEAASTDYKVYQLCMDVAFPSDLIDGSYGLSAGTRGKLFTALSKALNAFGLEMAGDMIDASEDVTNMYKGEGYEFFTESADRKLKEGSYNYTTPEAKALRKAIMSLYVDNEDEREKIVLDILRDVQEDLGESAEAKLEDNGELVDEENHDTVEPKKLTEEEEVPPVEAEAAPPAPPQAPPVTMKDTLDTWHMLDKYQINYLEFREGEGIVVSDEEYQRLLNTVLNKSYVQSLLVLESTNVSSNNLKEAVEVDTSRWSYSTGRSKPSGMGVWWFKIGDEEKNWSGHYAEAKKKAVEYAKSKGITRIRVMESTKESKSWSDINLKEFSEKSSGKAFYKTFKKMKDTLVEGTALTRQDSISLYKAANSAMTHLSVELEHNPEFLGTFKESVSLLSKDVDKLLGSLKEGKAPSKATMKSLSKFSEALLREDYEEEELAIEDEDDEFIGADEGELQSEEAEEFDQEYADARIELHKELEAEHADSEDPDVQEKLAQDVEEIVDLPGTTEEQVEELTGDGEESTEEPSEEPTEEEPEVEIDVPDSDNDITDDELAELKKHLKEMRASRLKK